MKSINYVLLSLFLLVCSCGDVTQNEEILDSYVGSAEWNPDQFAPLPDWAPIEMSFNMELDTLNNAQVLNLEIELHNPTADSILASAAAGTSGFRFDFVVVGVVGKKFIRYWSRFPQNIIMAAPRFIRLAPNESIYFRHTWDFTDYDGNRLEPGSYSVHSGLESLSIAMNYPEDYDMTPLYPDSLRLLKNIYGYPGVGARPKLILL